MSDLHGATEGGGGTMKGAKEGAALSPIPPSRARFGSREERVQAVMTMMRDNTFVRGTGATALAAEWGISDHETRRITSEASRRVLAEIKDPERLLATGLTKLEQIVDAAISDAAKDPRNAARHRQVASDAIAKLLTLSGSAAPTRMDHRVVVDLLPPAEVIASLEQTIADMQAEVERLRLEQGTAGQAPALPDAVDGEWTEER